ncbi:MAG: hypothetical protein CJBNEKGG_03362 [Prosthecobacter sp.]|nr:hypothetical protein [Prosthecobacter sp.]
MTPEAFWQWFSANADHIAADPNNPDLINVLDQHVLDTWPELAWEIGPDPTGDWYFALSPNLNRALAASAGEAIRNAPSVKGWRLYPVRQRKSWDGRFEFESQGRVLQFDSSGWQYVLLRYPEGDTEVVLTASEAASLTADDRWQAAAIVLEGLLGEACLLEHVNSFALEPVNNFSRRGKRA